MGFTKISTHNIYSGQKFSRIEAARSSTINFPGISSNGIVLNIDPFLSSSYPGSGTTVYDLSPNPVNGTLTGGPTFTSPYFQFDSTDDYIAFASSSKWAFGTGDFTLESWVYRQSSTSYTHIFAFPSQSTMALKVENSTGHLYLYTSSWDNYNAPSGWTLPLNTWTHVVFKREQGTGYAYLNSILKQSKVSFTNSFSAQILNIRNGYPGEFQQCRLGMSNIYNRALSDIEISTNYNSTRSRYGV